LINIGKAYELNLLIDSKIAQREACIALACKCTAKYDKVGAGANPAQDKILCKIADLQSEINADIDRLVDTKRQIAAMISKIDNARFRALLELRYLCFKKWEEIAEIMHYSDRQVRRLHKQALDSFKNVL
jgi:DNA-directed RNA polymerase specialized sigma subunit